MILWLNGSRFGQGGSRVAWEAGVCTGGGWLVLIFTCCSEWQHLTQPFTQDVPWWPWALWAPHMGCNALGKPPCAGNREDSEYSPSMSRRCMIIASSTSLGIYPNERIAMPSSCLDIKPFPSLSSTRKASRISAMEKEEELLWWMTSWSMYLCIGDKAAAYIAFFNVDVTYLIILSQGNHMFMGAYTHIVCRQIYTTASTFTLPIFCAKLCIHSTLISFPFWSICPRAILLCRKAPLLTPAPGASPAALLQAAQHAWKAKLLYIIPGPDISYKTMCTAAVGCRLPPLRGAGLCNWVLLCPKNAGVHLLKRTRAFSISPSSS